MSKDVLFLTGPVCIDSAVLSLFSLCLRSLCVGTWGEMHGADALE